jgi:hypothetical protein
MMKTILTAMLAVLTVAGSASAQSKAGTTVAQFLGIEPSARSAGMGNAGAGLHDGIESVYFNPGALGAIDRLALQLTHSLWFADITYDYVAGALPITGWGTVFGSVTSLRSGDIAVRTVDQPLGTGEQYNVTNVAVGLGFGRQITTRFAAGAQINYVNETIWHTSQNLFTINVGTVYQLTESGIRLGSSISNLGTPSQFSGRDLAIQYDADPDTYGDNSALPGEQFTDDYPVSILFRVGLSVPQRLGGDSRLVFVADAFHPSDNREYVSTGAEWEWKETLALRAGYQHLFQPDSELGLTLGVGLETEVGIDTRFGFDYAWADHDRLGETHRMTLLLGF